MDTALWAYPWDLVDEGPATVATRVGALGIDEVTVATNYHAVQAFLPHNPVRRTFFAHSSAYFQPRADYGRLEPVANETMGEADWIERVDDGLGGTPLGVNSWTVGTHNSRLGMAHPDLTLETPHGDSLVFGLCPSRDAVQTYLRTLVAELDDRFGFDRIELETFDYFYGTGFRWHHDKYHTRLGQLGEFLFGLCFCEACRANAVDAGVAVDRARATARATVDDIANGTEPPADSLDDFLAAHSSVAAYARARAGTLVDLFASLADDTDADLGYYAGLFDAERTWIHGARLDQLASALDYVLVTAYESSREAVVAALDAVREQTALPVHVGVLAGHPAIHEEATLVDIVDGLAAADVERVSFYNYGLVPEPALDWIAAAVRPHH